MKRYIVRGEGPSLTVMSGDHMLTLRSDGTASVIHAAGGWARIGRSHITLGTENGSITLDESGVTINPAA